MSTGRRVTFTFFDFTGGANSLPVEAPDGDWEAHRNEVYFGRGTHGSTALHGMLLILWKWERADPQAPVTPVKALAREE